MSTTTTARDRPTSQRTAASTTADRVDARRWLPVALAVAAVAWGANQFAPMLLVYREDLGISVATAQATFGLYAIGLVPGLLIGGPVSDRIGRRRVLVAALVASVLASGLLLVGGQGLRWLLAGRLVAGVASGAAFSTGAAWIKELAGDAGGTGARRATVAMTAGFAAGPLVAGSLAQWAPDRTVVPYLPHLVLTLTALALLTVTGPPNPDHRPARRTAGLSGHGALRPGAPDRDAQGHDAPGRGTVAVLHPRFLRVVVPLAPWVFGSAAIPLAYLPGLVAHRTGGSALIFGAVVAMLTALAGIAAQPTARRLAAGGGARLSSTSLGTVALGLLVAAAAAASTSPALVLAAALVLGAGYGGCQVCGLLEVGRLAPPDQLAGTTVAYQALSYTGFALPYLLAAVAGTVSPALGLLLLALVAMGSLVVVARVPASGATATVRSTAGS